MFYDSISQPQVFAPRRDVYSLTVEKGFMSASPTADYGGHYKS